MEKIDNWEVYMVLLEATNKIHKMTKICFPKDENLNFAISLKFNENCAPKVSFAF